MMRGGLLDSRRGRTLPVPQKDAQMKALRISPKSKITCPGCVEVMQIVEAA